MKLSLILETIGGLIVQLGSWSIDHPAAASTMIALTVGYIGDNIGKRPPPDPPTGWKMWLWQKRESIMFLPWDTYFGKAKLPFRIEPMLRQIRQGSSPETQVLEMSPKVAGRPERPELTAADLAKRPDYGTKPPPAAGRPPPTRVDETIPPTSVPAPPKTRDITETLPLPSSKRPLVAPPFPKDPPPR